jgi:hypothetical protein
VAVLAPFEFRAGNDRWCVRCARWLASLALLASAALGAATQPGALRDYQIKAIFLYNFAQFVEWPPVAFPEEETPLVIGVLGEDPFGTDLDDAVKGEKLGHRALLVRRFRRVEDVGACHILFISRSEAPRLERILASLQDRSILTVSDAEGFTSRGGMIRFVTENNKVRMRINLEIAKRAGLTLSSKLLRPADIVTQGRD